jgi:hypothetical protein
VAAAPSARHAELHGTPRPFAENLQRSSSKSGVAADLTGVALRLRTRISAPIVAALALVGVCLLVVAAAAQAGVAASYGSVTAHAAKAQRHVSVDERLSTSGVYEMTVVVTTNSRSASLTVSIGGVVSRVLTSNHRAVVHQRLSVHEGDVRISATARYASPSITASWQLLQSAPVGPTGPTAANGPTGATGPPNPVAVGINIAANSGDYFTSSSVLGAIQQSSPAWVRVFLGWNAIEPQQGVYNTAELANYQRFFAALPAGTKIDVDVEGTPAWAAGGSSAIGTPPTNDADYAGFLSYLVKVFAGRVTAWEIWNEEDNSGWWSGTAAQYAGLLKASYAAVKGADPAATVILGGLTGNDAPYLAELYAAGAQGSFDVVGVHTDTACNITSPYVYEDNRGTKTINQYFFLGFTSVYATMVANGDAGKAIYMTELGWSTTGAECAIGASAGKKAAGVDGPTQATYLQQAYHCLAQPQYSYVKVAMWFELVDNGATTDPGDNFGLFDPTFTPKPAFAAFEQESLHGDQLTGPCG